MSSIHRNVLLLAACQAMLLTNNSTLIAINALAGLALAPHSWLATLPVTCWVLGSALTTVPASFYMNRVGRRAGLIRGAGVGIVGALACATAVWLQNFWLLCAGTLVWGTYNAFGQYYRFAAAEVASVDFRATAISLVLAGGLVGGILGPTASRYTVDLLDAKFMGAYLGLIVFALIAIALLRFVEMPKRAAEERAASGRPMREIARQPKFMVAVLSGAVGYGVMNLLMTSTPIAMGACGHPFGDAAFVISSHVIAMFAPSFVTGALIKRLGVLPIMFVGALLNVGAIATAVSGISVAHFWSSLVLLGVGWNFLFVGATTLLTETYRPEERAKAQGANEFAIFVMMLVSSLSSGMIVTGAGWELLNLAALLPLAAVALAIPWLASALRSKRAVAGA
ncbi:MAG TPA: MFS transporter [Burkholderiales bacterium]|jgi:MFS family permease|nr:MFS transporter [Burkholderiales bacterium]